MCNPDKETPEVAPTVEKLPPSSPFGQPHFDDVPVWTVSPVRDERLLKKNFWTRSRVSVVVLTVLGCMVQCASYSVLQPFYPQVAEMKGNDATEIGIVFSIFPFIGFASSPLIGKMLSAGISPKTMLIGGLAVDGMFLSMMGYLVYIEDSTYFFIASMLTRLLEAIGFSICLTCYNTIISAQFPDNLQIMVPLVETVFGFGIMLGPAAGGVLYEFGGYQLPFVVFGTSSLLFACLALALLPNEKKLNKVDRELEQRKEAKEREINHNQVVPVEKAKIKMLLGEWRVMFDFSTVVVCCFVIGFNGATLALRIKELGLASASQSSLVFLTYGIVYATSSFANGILSNRVEDCRLLVLIGGLIFCTGLALLGPIPIIPIEPSWWLLMLSQALMGIGNGAIYNLSYVHTLKYVLNRLDLPSKAPTYALVACLFSTAFFFGAFFGPIVGGLLFDMVGFRWATTVALIVTLIPMIPMYPLVIRDYLRGVLQSTPMHTVKI